MRHCPQYIHAEWHAINNDDEVTLWKSKIFIKHMKKICVRIGG